MRRYRNDPYWLIARWPSLCAKCKGPIKAGERIFYYPKGRTVLSGKCAEDTAAEFESMAADEDTFGGM